MTEPEGTAGGKAEGKASSKGNPRTLDVVFPAAITVQVDTEVYERIGPPSIQDRIITWLEESGVVEEKLVTGEEWAVTNVRFIHKVPSEKK